MRELRFGFFSLLFALLSVGKVFGLTFSPYDFGLNTAKTGEERFWVLYNTHKAAVKAGAQVNYLGVDRIEIDIPEDAKTIPLSQSTDFKGAVLIVNNNKQKSFCLFKMANTPKPIEINKEDFCSFSFDRYPELRDGIKLLIIQDKTPWVENRRGHNYGAIRRDIIVIRNGKAINEPIYPYSSSVSDPIFQYVEESSPKKYFKNLTFLRTESSTEKTFLLNAQCINNLEISGILISTNNSHGWSSDKVISISNCANLTICSTTVNGTYSLPDRSGYAFSLNNVWNVTVRNVHGVASWGVFGCNNINKATIIKSNLNRFDLHCYGRDYSFKRCTIRDIIPLSSMFGKVIYSNCVFDRAYPCNFRTDYNAFTPFDLSFKRCKFKMDSKHNSIVQLSSIPEEKNAREELSKKCFPNIYMRNCEIWLDDSVEKWEILQMTKAPSNNAIGYISSIVIDGLKVYGNKADMYIVSKTPQSVVTERNIDITLSRIKVKGNVSDSYIYNYLNKGNVKNTIHIRKSDISFVED